MVVITSLIIFIAVYFLSKLPPDTEQCVSVVPLWSLIQAGLTPASVSLLLNS